MTLIRLRDLTQLPPTGHAAPARPWRAELLSSANLVLDLSEDASGIEDATKFRLDRFEVLLLANLLSGVRDGAEIDVVLPQSRALRVALARTPLLSVLAGHEGVQQPLPELEPWRRIWNPHDPAQRAEFLSDRTSEFSPYQAALLTLANPHLRPSSSLNRDVRGTVDPWLGRRFLPGGKTLQQAESLRMIERVMSELVENVGDHADVETTGRSPFSIAQLIITRGGGSASMDRFQMVVMDNGIGLPRSIRKRRSDLSGARAVEAALEGRLGVSQSDRNLGLRNVRSIIEGAPGSSFAILTGYREDKSRSISARVDDRGHVEVDELELPVFGTMAVAQIALPSVADDHPSLFDADPAELITVS